MKKNNIIWAALCILCIWQWSIPSSLGFIFTPASENITPITEVVFSPKSLKENNISWSQAVQSLEKGMGNTTDSFIQGEFFTYPIVKKYYSSAEQLGFFPVTENILLNQVATVAPLRSENNDWWYDPKVNQWKSGVAKEIISHTLSPLVSWWWHNYHMQKKDPSSYWIATSAPLFFYWQYIVFFIFLVWFFTQRYLDSSIDTQSEGKEFTISGVKISAAKVPKRWKLNFIAIVQYIKNEPISLFIGVLIFVFMMFRIGLSVNPSANVAVYPEENANSQHVLSVVQSAMEGKDIPLVFHFSDHSPSSLIAFTPSSSERSDFFKSLPLIWNNTTYFQANPSFEKSFSFPIWSKRELNSMEEAKDEMKKIASLKDSSNRSIFFWQPYTGLTYEILPNFSAMREKKIPIAEWTSFYQMIGSGISIDSLVVRMHNAWSVDFSQVYVLSSSGAMIPASEITIVTPQKQNNVKQSLFIRSNSLFDMDTLFITGFSYFIAWIFSWSIFIILIFSVLFLATKTFRHFLAEK